MKALDIKVWLSVLWMGFVCTATSHAQHFTLLSYNCENAFDTLHTPPNNDYDFLPDGSQHWTRWRFSQQLQRVAQVILAADTLKPVDIVVLQEVESDSVMHWLVHNTPLASIGYEYVMTNSRDRRGINVAILYQPFRFTPLFTDVISLNESYLAEHKFTPTRDILHVCGRKSDGDTLDVFAVHLPSKLGGGEARKKRSELLRLLFEQADSVISMRPNAQLIIAGDLNDAPSPRLARSHPRLHCMMLGKKGGSYKFHGRWEWIDQVWVSASMAESGRVYTEALRLPFLLEKDTAWGNDKPFRTFYGPRYNRGYSDHLPVVVNF